MNIRLALHTLAAMAHVLPLLMLVAACGAPSASPTQTGTLSFSFNGEDFARQEFVSKDGWRIAFDHVFVTVDDIAGHRTNPAYDAQAGGPIEGIDSVTIDGVHTVDLTEGGPDGGPFTAHEVGGVPAGVYNALSFRLVPAANGPAAGTSLLMTGSAEKDGLRVDFRIGADETVAYRCGQYVGDTRKGFLEPDGTTDLEMTFHLDHIFGDATLPADDALNAGALGFAPFAGDEVHPAAQLRLVEIVSDLAHVGEGHCHASDS